MYVYIFFFSVVYRAINGLKGEQLFGLIREQRVGNDSQSFERKKEKIFFEIPRTAILELNFTDFGYPPFPLLNPLLKFDIEVPRARVTLVFKEELGNRSK